MQGVVKPVVYAAIFFIVMVGLFIFAWFNGTNNEPASTYNGDSYNNGTYNSDDLNTNTNNSVDDYNHDGKVNFKDAQDKLNDNIKIEEQYGDYYHDHIYNNK